MDPATIAILISATTKIIGGLVSAFEAANKGEELTPEQLDAVTQARKLATAGLVDSIDAKLAEPAD